MTEQASELTARIRAEVARRADAIVGFTQEIVRVPSETHPPGGDEGPAQRVVAAKLEQLGLAVEMFEPWSVEGIEQHDGWWPGLDYEDRPNVVATWGGGDGEGRTLILNGHIDVVPPGARERWTADPYGAELRDGAIWGRGTVDMKGGVAAMIMAVEVLMACGWEPAGSVILESVVNEELGGYNGTLACCVKGYAGDAAIVTEPTSLNIVPASKGGQVYQATVHGDPVHTAAWWEGTSALDKALLVKQALVEWERVRARECADEPYFGRADGYPLPASADTIWTLRAGDPDLMANPETAELSFWVDVLPGDDREEVLARFERFVREQTQADAFLAQRPVELSRATMRPFHALAVSAEHPVVTSLVGAAAAAGVPSRLAGLGATSDAMIFNLYSSTPAVLFGPGDVIQAHAYDERLPVGELLKAVEVLALTIVDFCG